MDAAKSASSNANWTASVDPVTKLLLILFFTLAAFCAQNLVEAGIVLVFTLALVFALPTKKSLWTMTAFSLLIIVTMVVIQGLFWPSNQTVAFHLGTIDFYQEGLKHALLLGSRILVIIFSTSFFIETTTLSENSRYLEKSGLSFKQVYVLMSVCYILPQMHRNLQKIRFAQKARGIQPAKSLWSKAKTLMPVLVPLIVKSFQEAMNRSISLQLRGFDSPVRRVPKLDRTYWQDRACHRLLATLSLVLVGVKIWEIICK